MRPKIHRVTSPIQLGTVLSRALATVGITPETVEKHFGSCGCRRRAKKMNELSDWAWGILNRHKAKEENLEEKGKEELSRIINKPN